MRIRWIVAGPALLTLAGLLAVPAGVARAASFSLSSFDSVVVDAAHGHMFVSPGNDFGRGSNEIVVTSLAGREVSAITGLSGAQGLALSPDGATLYAALSGSDEVAGIDTTTLKTTATYSLPAGDSPAELAIESGELWLSYYDNNLDGGQAAIGEIDLTAASPAFTPNALPGTYYYAPKLAADPLGSSGTLVAEYTGISPDDAVGVYDVATTPPTAYLTAQSLASCPENTDVAVLPGGSQFVVAGCGQDISGQPPVPPGLQVFSTTTVAQAATWYAKTGTPDAVAVGSNGLVAVGSETASGPDLYVYKQGASTPQNAYTLELQTPAGSGQYFTLAPRGLGFAADGSALAAVAEDQFTTPDTFTVHELNDPAVTAASISLGGTASAVLGKPAALTGKLAYTVGSPAAGTKVKIVRSLAGSKATRVFTVSTGTGGAFKLTDTPGAVGTYTYTASYAGDSSHQAATGARTVSILRYPVALTLKESPGTANYHQRVTLTAHLGRTSTNRTVSFYAQPYGSTTSKLIKSGRVNSAGNISVTYVPAYDTLFSAKFSGDARYAAETAQARLGVRVSVTQADSGWYTSASYGGVLYRVFHQAGALKLTATVAPNKHGECVALEISVYAQGRWQPSETGSCGKLNSASRIPGEVSLSGAAGFQFRIRVDFIHNDKTNLASDGSWFYFAVTK
jgi:YVTN family beta-propeller protein